MREMKNSGVEWIGEIPADWKIVKVKQAFFRKNEKAQQENPVVLSLARSGVKVRDLTANEGQIAESYYNYNPVSVGDLLLNPMDLYSGANCSISKVEGVISPAYAKLRSKEGYFSNFYDYYFKVQYWMMVLFAHGKGVSFDNRWTLTNETLMNFPVVAPSLDEQHHIADFLDEKCAKIDAVIEKQKQIIEKLKEYKLSVITEAVTKGLDPTVPMKDSGVEWIGEVPEGWKIGKIKSAVFKVGSGKTPKGGSEIYSDEGILFIRSQNVYDEGLKLDNSTYISSDIDNEMSNTRVYGNDVLLNITGGSIGRTCIYPKGMPSANVNQHVCIIRTKEDVIKPEYMHYFWMSYCGKTSIDIFQTGANREGLNFEQINNTRIPYMSLSEQEGIITFLDKKCLIIDSAIAKKQAIVEKITEYKKSLIYEVVTGKREVSKCQMHP